MSIIPYRFIALLLALLLWAWASTNAYAQNAQKLSQGATAPYSGWLFTESAAQDLAKDKLLLKNKEEQILKFELIRSLTDTELEFYKKKNKDLANELSKQDSRRFWATSGAFVLGVVLTGLAAKAAIESSR
jgi:hypothetical protein